jgi:hypothetical protein
LGNPLKDVCVYAEPLSGRENGKYLDFDCTEIYGVYKLEMLPAGVYRIVANQGGRFTGQIPFGAVYHPGVTDRDQAATITLAPGDHLRDIDIRIPAMGRVARLSGRAVFQDGLPVADADVVYQSGTGRYSERTRTASDGSFQLPIAAGEPGELRAKILVFRNMADRCPQFKAVFHPNGLASAIESPPSAVAGDADQTSFALVLPVPSCAAWPER